MVASIPFSMFLITILCAVRWLVFKLKNSEIEFVSRSIWWWANAQNYVQHLNYIEDFHFWFNEFIRFRLVSRKEKLKFRSYTNLLQQSIDCQFEIEKIFIFLKIFSRGLILCVRLSKHCFFKYRLSWPKDNEIKKKL